MFWVNKVIPQRHPVSINVRPGDHLNTGRVVSRIVSRSDFFEVFWVKLDEFRKGFDSDFLLYLRP
jgi:hypothetical protein